MIQVLNTETKHIMRSLAVQWNGDFIEGTNTCSINLDNNLGKGNLTTYDLVPGLTAYVYDMTFFQEIEFEKQEVNSNVLYFFYCSEGHVFHKFKKEEAYEKLSQMRSSLTSSGDSGSNFVKFPKNVPLQISVLVVRKHQDRKPNKSTSNFLTSTITKLDDFIDTSKGTRYKGEIDLKLARFVSLLIKNKRTDAVGRLTAQAAILNILSTQLDNYKSKEDTPDAPLLEREMEKIVSLNNFISKNMSARITVESLSRESGLNAKKLQDGCRYLYGETVNSFVKNVKLEYARELLQTTNYAASQIANEIGINSKSYFTKIFKERYGVLPSRYGQMLQSKDIIFELSYKSKMKDNFDSADLKDILQTARIFNKKHKITGCLVTYDRHFFQLLEGPKDKVLALYDSIKQDNRHHEVTLIWKGPKTNRLFANWDLALISEEGVFEIRMEGTIKNIDMKNLFDANENQIGISPGTIWRRLRNLIKVA